MSTPSDLPPQQPDPVSRTRPTLAQNTQRSDIQLLTCESERETDFGFFAGIGLMVFLILVGLASVIAAIGFATGN